FAPLDAAQWRNPTLDFSGLDALLRSLTQPSPRPGLQLAKEALDEKALRLMAQDEAVAARIRNPVTLRVLWEACQLPDFRKIGLDEHLKLVAHLFHSRLSPDGVIAEDWFEAQLQSLDKMEGDIDTLSSRLSGVRTLAYIAHRGGWLKRTEHWREVTRDLEERLSDRLHEALMQRFIDQRTSALLRALHADEAPRPEVNSEGQVIMEGHVVGDLKGLTFQLSSSETLIEDKTLRQAAHRAILPLLLDRLRDLGNAASKTLRIRNGRVLWNNEPVARIEAGDWFAPQIRLLGEIDHPALAARAVKRLTDYVRTTAMSQLKGLWKAKQTAEAEGTAGPVRAIAYQLYENGGIVRRDDSVKLSPEDKAALKTIGVAAHRYAYFLPEALNPKTRHFMQGFVTDEKGAGATRALSARGLMPLGDHPPVSTKTLSQLDKIMGAGLYQKGAVYVREADFAPLGLDAAARDKLLQALGLVKVPPIMTPVVVKASPASVQPVQAEVAVEPPVDAARPEPDTSAEVDIDAADTAPVAAVAELEPDVANPDVPASEVPAVAPAAEPKTGAGPVAEVTEMEERIGWRQRRVHDDRPQRDRRPKPAQSPEHEASKEKPHKHGKGHKTHGYKPRKDEGNSAARPERKPAERKPYVNPYSPFAILAERLK
ncbi:MAG: helicase-related protein, partial [Asticcacaulis sp.]